MMKLGTVDAIFLGAGLLVTVNGLTDVYNAYTERKTLAPEIALSTACEKKLSESTACTLPEQKALLLVQKNEIKSEASWANVWAGAFIMTPVGRF